MKIANEEYTASLSSAFGSVSVEKKQAKMVELVAGRKDLRLKPVSDVTLAERKEFAPMWDLHGEQKDASGNITYNDKDNLAVTDKDGKPVMFLSRTMHVYFMKACAASLSKASHVASIQRLTGYQGKQSSLLGKQGHKALAEVLASNKPVSSK